MTFWNELQRFIIFGLIGALNSVLDVLLWKFFVNYFSKKPTPIAAAKNAQPLVVNRKEYLAATLVARRKMARIQDNNVEVA